MTQPLGSSTDVDLVINNRRRDHPRVTTHSKRNSQTLHSMTQSMFADPLLFPPFVYPEAWRFDPWPHPAVIAPNHFVNKSLSDFAFNIAIGCDHGCLFCYVPQVSVKFQKSELRQRGIDDPDSQWGQYVLLRAWDENKFLSSLRKAENAAREQLSPDGNRAIIFCSTTDPYQIIRHPDPVCRRELTEQAHFLVRHSLELILEHSTLNVRILTRSPLARQDFDLYRQFGPRLMFGMSLPTLRNDLAKIYEPKAPAPTQRLATLRSAKEHGLNIYVAVAPTYPECDEDDLRSTLKAVAGLEPLTIFHEPINIRAKNVARIQAHAEALGVVLRTDVFATPESWQDYAIHALHHVHTIARELGIEKKLHLWPDKDLGSPSVINRMSHPREYAKWIHHWWARVSEWPTPLGISYVEFPLTASHR